MYCFAHSLSLISRAVVPSITFNPYAFFAASNARVSADGKFELKQSSETHQDEWAALPSKGFKFKSMSMFGRKHDDGTLVYRERACCCG